MINLIMYFVFVLISMYLHYQTLTEEVKKKYTTKVILLEIFHHFLSNYISFGIFLFNNNKYHLIVVIIVLISWIMNGGGYPLTLYCNIETKRPKKLIFKDLNYFILKKINITYYQAIFVIILTDLYLIWLKRNKKLKYI